MRITAKHYDIKVTVELSDEADLNEIINMFKSITIALGFQDESWIKLVKPMDLLIEKLKKEMLVVGNNDVRFEMLRNIIWEAEQLKQK